MIEKNSNFLLYSTWGWSMFPFIRSGDYILVKKVPLKKIQAGDAIVFESDTKTKVCHRVTKIERRGSILWFHTYGYRNSPCNVYPVRQERVLGKVVALKRKSSIIELSSKRLQSLLPKFDCFFTQNIFYIKKILIKIPFINRIYRYLKPKINFFLR